MFCELKNEEVKILKGMLDATTREDMENQYIDGMYSCTGNDDKCDHDSEKCYLKKKHLI